MEKDKQIVIQFTMSSEPDIKKKEEAVEETALLLEQIAKQVREGYTSGHYPAWDLTITENENTKQQTK